MIKFFRRIRQRLLSENKFSKYLLYAIGEIILVVIGILIALQIDNWNQEQKDRVFEITMLNEIKSSLESDLASYNMMSQRIKFKQEGIQEILKISASNKNYADTTLLKAYNKMNTGLNFIYNKGGYEAIKSIGIDKISNDSLRKIIIETYEVNLPMVEMIINYTVEDLASKDYKLNLHNALWERIRIQLPDKSYKLVSKPINSELFLNQSELLDRIKIEQDVVSLFHFWMQRFKSIVEDCLDEVNKELNHD